MNRPLANSAAKIRLSEQKTKGYTIFLKKICNFAADFYNNKVEFTF